MRSRVNQLGRTRIHVLRNPEEVEVEATPPVKLSPLVIVSGFGMGVLMSGITGGIAGSVLQKGFRTGFAIGATSSAMSQLVLFALKGAVSVFGETSPEEVL